MDEEFGVPRAADVVPARNQFGAQGLVIEELAIEDHNYRLIFVERRLLPALEVNDAQSPYSQSQSRPHECSGFVRTAMPQRERHLRQGHLVDGPFQLKVDDPYNSTHVSARK